MLYWFGLLVAKKLWDVLVKNAIAATTNGSFPLREVLCVETALKSEQKDTTQTRAMMCVFLSLEAPTPW